MIGELIMRLFHARTAAHVLHLKSRSYAQHKALNEFYDEVVGLADTIAEAWQGAHGLISEYPGRFTLPAEPIPMLEELCAWVKNNRYKEVDRAETNIQNEIDNVVTLIDSKLYKLRHLK
jgi:hypothetical protein